MDYESYGLINKEQQLLESLQLNGPMKELRNSLKLLQMHDPMKELRDSLAVLQMHDPMKELRDSLAVLQMHDPMKELRDSLTVLQMHDPMKELRSSLETLQMYGPIKQLRESLRECRSIGSIHTLIHGFHNEGWGLGFDSEPDFSIDSGGFVTIESEKITQESVQKIAQGVVDRALEKRGQSLEESIERIFSEIRSIKDPLRQRLLAWLIFPVIVGLVLAVVNPVADHYIKGWLGNGEKRQVVKGVSREVLSSFGDKPGLTVFRIVSAGSLSVKVAGSKKSDTVGSLYLGDVVEVVSKGRSWTLVAWSDGGGDGVLLRGWVFSRYLKKIKKNHNKVRVTGNSAALSAALNEAYLVALKEDH